jgi:hypothetical protein
MPLRTNNLPQKDKRKDKNESRVNSSGDQDLRQAWIVAWVGREIFLGSLILSLLFLNETRALGLAMTLGNVVGAADTIAALKGGTKGSYKKHLIPTVLVAWVGPLGLFLHSRT